MKNTTYVGVLLGTGLGQVFLEKLLLPLQGAIGLQVQGVRDGASPAGSRRARRKGPDKGGHHRLEAGAAVVRADHEAAHGLIGGNAKEDEVGGVGHGRHHVGM